MSITNSTVLPAPVAQSFSYKLLSVPTPYFIHRIPAQLKRMPRNGGTTLRFRRYNALPSALVPLGNSGVTPPPVQLTAVNIDAEMDFYGQYIILNEQVTLQNQDPVLNEATKRLGVSLRLTEDTLVRDMLAATASFINATNGMNADNPTEITRDDVDVIIRTLAGNDAYTIADNIEGDDRFGTAPVRDAYFGMAHTDLIGDLEEVTGFLAKAQYPSPMHALQPEWGSISNVRYLLSSNGSITPNASLLGADIYNIFVTGLEAFAVVEQDGYSSQFIYRPPIYDSPLALNASVGWKMGQVPRILNDAWVLNQRVTLST